MSTSNDVKAKTRRTIECSESGLTYVVRALPLWKFIGALRAIPELMEALDEAKKEDKDPASIARSIDRYLQRDAARSAPMFERLITAALVTPEIGKGEDQIEVADIPWNDQGMLVSAILDLSGFNAAAAEALRPTSSGQNSSSSSTVSAADTDSDPRPSSETTESSGS